MKELVKKTTFIKATFNCSTARKMFKYGVFSGPYFPVFGWNTEIYHKSPYSRPNTGKYGPENTPYLDSFHGISCLNGR